LLHQVRRIEWDECVSEAVASEREALLICVLAPKFNAAGKVWERRRSVAFERFAECNSAIRQIENLRYDVRRAMSKTRLVAAAARFVMKSA